MSISKKDKLLIGIALKPHGIKGEIKVSSLADEKSVFDDISHIYFQDEKHFIDNARLANDCVYLKLKGIDNRTDADYIRGELYTDRDLLPTLDNDRHYIVDLIGIDVYIEDIKVGYISEVLSKNANDVIVVSGDSNFMFPFLSKVVIEINNEKIVLSKTVLQEIAVY